MDVTAELLRRAYPLALARVLRQTTHLQEAEDAVQEAVARALETWDERGVPDVPEAWLVPVALNHHADELRRRQRQQRHTPTLSRLAPRCPWTHRMLSAPEALAWRDDILRLVFTCCDPQLAIEERAALALATVAGLSTEEIARAFLVTPSAMERRLSRARQRLRERRGRYEIPPAEVAPERVDAALAVIHFVFNEGYWATGQEEPIRLDLTRMALSLARSLELMLPEHPEVKGLLALLILHEARMPARLDEEGRPVTLEAQDRSRWDREAIAEARALLEGALARRQPGPFQIEAAIAAVHCAAARAEQTDWREIAALYEALEDHRSSPVVRVNRAFAVSRTRGPGEGLALLAEVDEHPALERYSYAHLVRGVLLAEAGRGAEARDALEEATRCASNPAEREQIEARLEALLAAGA